MMDINDLTRKCLEENKVAIFVVAYNAEHHIEKVLKLIPTWIAERLAEIYVIDDHSADNTKGVVENVEWPSEYAPLRVFRTPYNQGYGGNQRLGYLYALERGFDIVVLLHGDGQYAPEALPYILAPYAEGADAVFGSRFIHPKDAIKGGMPLYKWVGNRILTGLQNKILGVKMSEMHSGYRSYRTSVLQNIPFTSNSLGFDFDADIIVQLHATGKKIVEVPIPTFYGDEICHVNGMQYAWQCIKTALRYRAMQFEIFYDPKFDIKKDQYHYSAKQAKTSLHYFIRQLSIPAESDLLDVGGGEGEAVGRTLAEKGISVTSIDQYIDARNNTQIIHHQVDLDAPWENQFQISQYDYVLALDVIEHLRTPEQGVAEIFRCLKSGGKLYASTGNIAFFPLRLALLFGWFNYGRRGILDLTHRRLFTIDAFRRLFQNGGFQVDRIIGFGPPLQDLGGKSGILSVLDKISSALAKSWPSLFAYQVLIECTRTDSPDDLMKQMFPLYLALAEPCKAEETQLVTQ